MQAIHHTSAESLRCTSATSSAQTGTQLPPASVATNSALQSADVRSSDRLGSALFRNGSSSALSTSKPAHSVHWNSADENIGCRSSFASSSTMQFSTELRTAFVGLRLWKSVSGWSFLELYLQRSEQ